MVRFVVLKGFGPLDHQVGPWMTKNKVLTEEMFTGVKLRSTVGATLDIRKKA